jgi:tRNA nucleotidyltransferase/poly(A) polymerase
VTNKKAAIGIIKKLRKNGYQALLAGGCVRDTLLSREPKDYDVATDAHPEQVIKLFRRTLEIGAQFGVVIVLVNSEQIEVATFRTEGGYTDGRHPEQVSYSDAEHDASRRDFTINGMFYDPVEEKVIDYVNGKADLQAKVIRTIGAAEKRFGEDYLRMLRAIRFSCQLGFEIAADTWNAIAGSASNITCISGERIAMEIEAIVSDPGRADGIKMLMDSGLANTIFPEFAGDKAAFGIKVLENLSPAPSFPLALAGMFAGFSASITAEQLRILKLSNADTKHVGFLLENRGKLLNADMSLAELKLLLATGYFGDLYEFQSALLKAGGESDDSLLKISSRTGALEGTDITPKPLLDGNELIALGIKLGPMVGLIGRKMYEAQLNEELKTAAQAEEWVTTRLKNGEFGR